MEHFHFHILAYPSGRLIGERAAYDVDMERIIQAASEQGCALELNPHPERLYLQDIHCKMPKEIGVPICINSDAHSTLDFNNLRYAVGRRGAAGWRRAMCSTPGS